MSNIRLPIRKVGYGAVLDSESNLKLSGYYDIILFYARRLVLDSNYGLNEEVLLNEIYNNDSYLYSVTGKGSPSDDKDINEYLKDALYNALEDIKYYSSLILEYDIHYGDIIVTGTSVDTVIAKIDNHAV